MKYPVILTFLLSLVFFGCDDSPSSQNTNNLNNTNNANNSNNLNNTNNANNSNNLNNTNNVNNSNNTQNPPLGYLEFVALDIWAMALPENEATLQVSLNGTAIAAEPADLWPSSRYPLTEPGNLTISLEAPYHYTLELSVSFDPAAVPPFHVTHTTAPLKHGISSVAGMDSTTGSELPMVTVFGGLRHKWFSAQGRPARRGNTLELFIDGETYWESLMDDILTASNRILLASWWWESNFELVRDPATHISLTPTQRWENTIMKNLEDSPAVKRILVGEFWGTHDILDWITTDDEILAHAETPADSFEFMGQGNPTSDQFYFEPATFTFGDRVKANFAAYADQTFQSEDPITSDVPGKDVDFSDWPLGIAFQAASWHQKFSVFDDSVAYVGGMNVKAGDWDTQYHLVFDYRRMNFDATEAERVEVINKERDTDSVPRKDYFLRIHGPAAQDAADIFKTRWDYQLAQGADYAENSSAFTINRNIAPQPGGIPVQIAATMPEPFWEHAIAETWLNAFRQAQDYVFIDDQYFRIPLLLDALMEEMRQKPSLKLVVVILNIDEWTDGGCYWTYDAHNKLMAEFPDRYSLFKLATFDHVVTWGFDETESRYADIYTHDKMLIVDDIFLSVGSANKNNRGIIYEGEITATVLDSAWVKAQRRRIIANMVGPGYVATDDSSNWYNQMITSATWNDEVYTRWEDENGDIDNGDGSGPLPALYTPSGFLYSYHPGSTSDCFIEGIGPDLF